MQSNTEEKLKRAVELYAKREGEALLSEIEEIHRQRVSYLMPRADKVVREFARHGGAAARPRPRRVLTIAVAAAACVMLIFRVATFSSPISLDNAAGLPAVSAPEAAALDEVESGAFAPAPAPGGLGDFNEGREKDDMANTAVMPITFALPAGYREIFSDYDNGMTIYEFESLNRGDVVLTMYYVTDAEDWSNYSHADRNGYLAFTSILVDGTPVPAKVEDTYMLLAFERGGVSYTLSSKDDLGALAAFYRSIAV